MAKWFHPEVNGVVDLFPKDEADEQVLRSQGLYPADDQNDVVLEQAQAAVAVKEAIDAILEEPRQAIEDAVEYVEKRKPGRPRKA